MHGLHVALGHCRTDLLRNLPQGLPELAALAGVHPLKEVHQAGLAHGPIILQAEQRRIGAGLFVALREPDWYYGTISPMLVRGRGRPGQGFAAVKRTDRLSGRRRFPTLQTAAL